MIRTREFEQDNEKVREFQNLENRTQLSVTGPKELDIRIDQSVIEGCKLVPIHVELVNFLNNWIGNDWDALGVYTITFYHRQWKYNLMVPIDMASKEELGPHIAPTDWASKVGLDFRAIALETLTPFLSRKVTQ